MRKVIFSLLLISTIITIIQLIPSKQQRENNEKYENPNDRQEQEFLMLRDPVTNQIPKDIYKREQEFINKIKKDFSESDNPKLLNWTERGPNNVGGRARALAIDIRTTTPPNIILNAGGVSGGLWRSTNDGASWTKTTLNSQLHSTTCMVQDTRTGTSNGITRRDIWYAGSGESYGSSASATGASYRGDGIFRTTNNGLTWTQLPSTVSGTPQTFDSPFDYIFNIAIDPSNTSQDVIYAACCQLIMKSTNGGNNWIVALGNGSSFSSAASDVQVTSTGIVYATINSTASGNPGIWKSTNSGANWTNINPSFMPAIYNRIVIGIAPSNENIVYFLGQTPGAGKPGVDPPISTEYCSLWKYNASTSTWTDLSSNLPNVAGYYAGFNTQGSYNLVIRIKPDDPNFVIIGSTNLYRSTNGFTTLVGNSGWIGGYSPLNGIYTNHHPDVHVLVFRPGSNVVLYSGSDGGLSRTDNVTTSLGAEPVSWTSLNNGFNVTQFYSVSIAPESANNLLLGGTQDNGNLLTNSPGLTNWTIMFEGDGCFTAIAPISDDRIYMSSQYGEIRSKKRDMTVISSEFMPTGSYNQLFVNPFVLDPNNSSYLYYAAGNASGNTGIWRNNNVKSTSPESYWDFLSTSAITGTEKVSAFGISTLSNPNVLYFGTTTGTVKRIDNANSGISPTITTINAGLPAGGYINCIAVDPASSSKAIVVFTNYNFQSLWYTTNSGAAWTDIEGNLSGNAGPSIRWAEIFNVSGINHYFLGTSIGIFFTTNLNGSSTVWYPDAVTSIGNNVVRMLKWRSADKVLAAATHGRGIFTVQISTPLPSNTTADNLPDKYYLYQNYPNPFNIKSKIKYQIPKGANTKLSIFDISGKEIATLVNEQLQPGTYEVTFDGSNLTSGIYFYELTADNFTETKKMLMIK